MVEQLEVTTQKSRLKLCKTTLLLAYQSFGVVYGDLCISPIYVYRSTFSGSLRLYQEDHEIFGLLSLIFWTLTIIPLCKYIVFVLAANDHGEGGTFALYSLLCRHSKAGLLKNCFVSPDCTSSCDCAVSGKETRTSLFIKEFFEKHRSSRVLLLLLVLLGASMVIGDGILTPTMSVLSAVSGIEIKFSGLHENFTVSVACIVLIGLFALQHYGTHRVGFLFAPISITWLICISGLGIYNIIHWNPGVLKALSPYYIYIFFQKTGKHGWSSLGRVVLCVTGAEALFADLGHFSLLSLRITFAGVVYPSLVLAYMGEAAYLSKNRNDLRKSFFRAIPDSVFWPVFTIATLATVVGGQAIISATFSIISQCRALGCFPRIKIKHTSSNIHGQIYIPEVNWMLMILCLAVVIGFRDTDMIGNAYGLAVITVMFVTTLLMAFVIITVWKQNLLFALLFVLIFGFVELSYFGACLAKVHEGGWFPLAVSVLVLSLMLIWHYGTMKKQAFELENKVSLDHLMNLGPSMGLTRVPGICLVFSNLSFGVPPMFAHFVTNFPAFHQVLVFVTLQSLMIPKVPINERFHVSRIGSWEPSLFRCTIRYGYKDVKDSYNFETQLIDMISEFMKYELRAEEIEVIEHPPVGERNNAERADGCSGRKTGSIRRKVRCRCSEEEREEVKQLMEAKEAGVAYMMGNVCVMATETSSFLKRFVVNVVYGFIRRNSRSAATALGVPHFSLIEVGTVYHV